ncbi:Z1 domain-containing protein [Micromonospora chalcea]|uniref:Z1 domain-containing protein n=1 Tax=Micromonospora chalcea TaxID=1874 RepID=UPI003CF9E07A
MAITPSDWEADLKEAIAGLVARGPAKLLKRVNVDRDDDAVTMADLQGFLEAHNQQSNSTVLQLAYALAQWDFDDDEDRGWDAAGTLPRTAERRQRVYELLGLSPEVATRLDTIAPVATMRTTVISTDWDPWYDETRRTARNFYWAHYERHLIEQRKWHAESIAALNKATTDVVRRLADPTAEDTYQTKGLVVGYVQSGKTANFTGVIAKAIDAGYRLVIVMTGTIELLRSQTQRRLDQELVGVENLTRTRVEGAAEEFDYEYDDDWLAGKFISHGKDFQALGYPGIERLTLLHDDYKRLKQGLTSMKFEQRYPSKPFYDPDNLMPANVRLVVVKKIKSSLQKLAKDLAPLKGKLAEIPALIIDDESDLASVNTKNPAKTKDRTAINRAITDLLGLLPRGQLVMYTATPFANFFVDPDDANDIYPKNFIIPLDRPPHYMGVRDFHDVNWNSEDDKNDPALSNERAFIRPVGPPPDPDDPAQMQQRKREMLSALDSFVLAGAIKVYREKAGEPPFRHHTMLVHEATDTRTHREQADLVRSCWTAGQYGTPQALARLRDLWNSDFAPVCAARADGRPIPSDFEDLREPIGEACRRIREVGDPVLVVNSDREVQDNQQELDFDRNNVWRILVGGTKLSRGFTVEGLTVSFYTRKALQADTLMQAGRWFGFRQGYEDLVRLFIRRDQTGSPRDVDLYEAFEGLLHDEETVRDWLRQYEGWTEDGRPVLEPWQVPALVSQHLPYLRPTGRSKMFNAEIDSRGDAGRLRDFYGLPRRNDIRAKEANYNLLMPLLAATAETRTFRSAPSRPELPVGAFKARVGTIDAPSFVDILRKLQWHPDEKLFGPTLTFYETLISDGRLDDVLIVWPELSRVTKPVQLPGIGQAQVVTRKRRTPPRIDFVGSDSKHRNALERIAGSNTALDDSEADGLRAATGRRGSVLLYVAADLASLPDDAPCTAADLPDEPGPADVSILLSMVAPATATANGRSVIRWKPKRTADWGKPVVDNRA